MSSSVLEKLKKKPVLEKIEDYQFKFKIKQDDSNQSNEFNELNLNIQESANVPHLALPSIAAV